MRRLHRKEINCKNISRVKDEEDKLKVKNVKKKKKIKFMM